jgi:hypothetical protein
LKWDGSHCLRHGSIVEAGKDGLASAQARSGHLSTSMSKEYARNNSERRRGTRLSRLTKRAKKGAAYRKASKNRAATVKKQNRSKKKGNTEKKRL